MLSFMISKLAISEWKKALNLHLRHFWCFGEKIRFQLMCIFLINKYRDTEISPFQEKSILEILLLTSLGC